MKISLPHVFKETLGKYGYCKPQSKTCFEIETATNKRNFCFGKRIEATDCVCPTKVLGFFLIILPREFFGLMIIFLRIFSYSDLVQQIPPGDGYAPGGLWCS